MLYDHDDWFTEHDDSRHEFELEPLSNHQYVITYVDDGVVHRLHVSLQKAGPPSFAQRLR